MRNYDLSWTSQVWVNPLMLTRCVVPNPDQVNLVSRKMVDWLRYASMQQGASVSSGGFFSGQRARQVEFVTSVDSYIHRLISSRHVYHNVNK